MYKRPNAPFRPPRPISHASKHVKSESGEQATALFVSESNCQDAEPTKGQSDEASDPQHSDAPRSNKYVPKRVKRNPVLLRRNDHRQTSLANRQTINASQSPPILSRQNSSSDMDQHMVKRYYTVQWRKRSNKKNKSWEGDGFVVASQTGLVLRTQILDGSYKIVGRTKNTDLNGVVSIGVYEVEVDCETSRQAIFGADGPASVDAVGKDETLMPNSNEQTLVTSAFKAHAVRPTPDEPSNCLASIKNTTDNLIGGSQDAPVDSFVLPSLSAPGEHEMVVDERLTKFLRPHQKEGISFIYQCLMGMRNKDHHGALLADEMGLGKTLMTITLIWTLLKQSPMPSEKSVVNKVLVCCPVSLIDNWRKEFGKWLDLNRIGVLALNNKSQSGAKEKQEIVNFGKTKVYQVLIVNYEKILACSKELSAVDIDFLICDEGHRLKSSTNKVLKQLSALPVKRRLVLTGTPIQNDLNEFYNITNFINPGLLGTFSEFQKEYLKPILRARDVNCFDAAIAQEGREKSAALIEVTKSFTIRRTKAVIEDYLTPKTDVLLFCQASKLQKKLFHFVIDAMGFKSLVSSGSREVLPTINLLRKICNSPSLLADDAYYKSLIEKNPDVAQDVMPCNLSSRTTGSKINIAIPLLMQFRDAGENVVLVSNFTQTLDFLERVLLKLNFSYSRLDGSSPSATRDHLVTAFNKSKKHEVFLLSAKAGGVGLNLTGASRLILFDNDWNPSVDLQAMARIHRDGQQNPVFIYRLFTTGSIDEKIFQRQLMKNNLSDMFLDDNVESTSNVFDYEDLRDLFTVVNSSCNTHDLIDCECHGNGDEISVTEVDSQKRVENPGSAISEALPGDISRAHRSSSSGWISALEYKEMDQTSAAKKQTIRSALSRYRHFDPSKYFDQMDTGDQVVNSLISRAQTDLTYIFTYRKADKAPLELLHI